MTRCAGDGVQDPLAPPRACGTAGPFRPELHCIQEAVFTPICAVAGCHAGPTPQQGMELSEGEAWSSTVGVPSVEMPALSRVDPGDPELSYLIWKLEGDPNIIGERMPFGGPYLSQAEIDVIAKWIRAGAKDD